MSQQLKQTTSQAHSFRHLKRSQVEDLLSLAQHLPPEDRMIIEQVLEKGTPITSVARLCRRPPRQLQRRAESILKRMKSKMFTFVALYMNTLPTETRPTAKLVVLHGKSMREASHLTGSTLHHVRKHMHTIHATARLLS